MTAARDWIADRRSRRAARGGLVADRVLGARIERAETREDGLLVLVFAHRGTDDDSGYMIVPPALVAFNEGGRGHA